MIRKTCFLLITVVAMATTPRVDAQLVINELMQSNIDCIMDDLNEFPDSWVELYNSGTSVESLGAYKIGTSSKLKKAYGLPEQQIEPGQFVLVYCDKAETGIHTDFRLESGKDGAVYLFKDGEVVDKIEGMKKQPAPNIAYGKKTEGSDEYGYQDVPTPGAANCGTLCTDILGNPVFSTEGKVFTSSLKLELSLPEGSPEGTVIRYTTDGKEPTAQSKQYTSAINISKTTVVRAKLFCDGYLSPRSLTHSYINHTRNVTLPVVSIVTDNSYFYDSKIGIYVDGNYDKDTPNYRFDWRRPINYEYFEGAESPSVINQLCETRVKGGYTRSNSLKSLALYANKRFGEKRFDYEFFPEQTPGITDFKSFEMRNSGNDFDYTYFRDAVIQQSVGLNADLDWQPSQPVIFYLNGTYKGILNIRPRSNDDYVYTYYNGLEDIDMIENLNELKCGTWDNYNAFKEFYSEKGHAIEEFRQLMDVEEYCNLMILGIFYDNKDFPGNNIVTWRPIEEGGKWRWIAKDADFGMGLYGERYNYPTLKWITTPGYDNDRNSWANSEEATKLFCNLLEVEEFKEMFIDRSALYMGDFMTTDNIIALINKRYDELKFEYKYHRALFNPWWPNYDQEVENARKWTRNRWTFFYQHVADFFELGKPVPVTIDVSGDVERTLVVNDLPLVGNSFNGKYFVDRNLTVKSLPAGDTRYVVGWKVTLTNGADVQTTTYRGEMLEITIPNVGKVDIETILSDTPDTVENVIDTQSVESEVFDLSGRCLGKGEASVLAPGIYIVREGVGTRKIIVN